MLSNKECRNIHKSCTWVIKALVSEIIARRKKRKDS